MKKHPASFWFLQISGWLFAAYLLYAQGISALDYDYGVAMGTQEPATRISEVGTAFWYGFAFGDAVFYIPLLIVGLIALWGMWGLWWLISGDRRTAIE